MKRRIMMFFMAIVFALGTIILPQLSMVATVKAATFDDLNQSQIVTAMGPAWNLGNSLEATNNGTPSETAWGNPTITQSFIQSIADAGFDTIRIPVSWLNYIGSSPNYTINSTWMSRVKQVVDYAINSGLYVIINLHGDGYSSVTGGWVLPGSSDQTTIKAKYEKVWTQIATTFATYDEHLIFESMNEVGADANYVDSAVTSYYTNINAYNQIFVNAVRGTGGNNAKRWLLVPGWNTNIYYTAGNYGFTLPSDSSCTASGKRIMVSVHYYTPWDFCGAESYTITQWGNNANSSKAASYGGEASMLSEIQSMYNKFISQGYPVVIGEYGSVDKSAGDSTNTSFRAYFAQRLCELSKQYGCIPAIWDNGYNGNYGFGLFNRSTGAVTQQSIINAIMNVYSSTTPTVTPTPTVKPTVTPTVTPSVTPTVAPTVTPTVSNLDIKFYGTTAAQSNTMSAKYKLTNNGSTAITLSNVKLRYYYTKEGTASQNVVCDWASVGNQYVTGTFTAISPAKTTADYYLELSFATGAGSLAAGQSAEVQVRVTKSDWSNYTLSNDYSYNSSATTYASWQYVTAYISNTRVYGIEP